VTDRLRFGAFAVVATLALAANAGAGPGATRAARPASADKAVCQAVPGAVRCAALVAVDARNGTPLAYPSPPGLDPPDFWSAYDLPAQTNSAWSWNGETIAVVDAYDDPTLEADLNTYRSQFGLPPCTQANGCLVKVNQFGRKNFPSFDQQWAFEISIDTQMASALCAGCRIVVVETKNNSFPNLFAGVDEAYAENADAISLSWGTNEFSGNGNFASETGYDAHFQQHTPSGRTAAVTAASGDAGRLWYPAASPYVTAVGGTSVTRDAATGAWDEVAWSLSGAGCSIYEPQPAWQSAVANITGACAARAGADVAFNATDLSIYDSAGYEDQTGWFAASGTSDSAPAIAALYALAGNASNVVYGSYPYAHTAALYDVTQFPEASCSQPIFCNPGPGWDGPTGLGSPRGTGGF
jgi:subtilase family serine protease